ncbi:hypothetical protein Vretimale_9541 [Volvox reticuliferus]|nr:hypothetical protein Vretifemale_19270 [Volvox reticuliferus]GIM05125.1 hypothetical protein Vretimale_9541 [Volvox reticuliferus]
MQLHALLSELLRPELPQPQHSQHQGLEPAADGMEGPAGLGSGASKESTTASDETIPFKGVSQGSLDLSWWWVEVGCVEGQEGGGVPATSMMPSPLWTPSQPLQQQEPHPPLSLGPCGLTHPGYEPYGYLRRPYALQLAWAVAVWRVTGCFPYPVIRQQRPPRLRESDVYDATLEEIQALMPLLLLPEVAADSSTATAATAVAAAVEGPVAAQECNGPIPIGSDDHDHIDGDVTVRDKTVCGTVAVPAVSVVASAAQRETREAEMDPATNANVAFSTTNSVDAAATALRQLLLNVPAVYLLLGFRLTAGSASQMVSVPSARECFEAFERKHSSPENASVLTVGARALSKHTHRDLQGEWWPRMTGSEATKNQLARGSLQRLLAGALWLNVHQLPPFDAPKHVLEIRNVQGYGARWAIEPVPIRMQEHARIEAGADSCISAKRPTRLPSPSLLSARQPQRSSPVSKSLLATGEGREFMTADVLLEPKEELGPDGQVTGSAPRTALMQQAAMMNYMVPAADIIGNAYSTVPYVKPPATVEAPPPRQEIVPQITNREVREKPGESAGTGPVGVAFQRPRVQFRGFLEPQMEGGHEAGWRH